MSTSTDRKETEHAEAQARAIRADIHDRRRKKATGIVRSVFTLPDTDPAAVQVEPGDFVMPTQAEINATKLEVERYKRRLLDAPLNPHGATDR